MRKYFRIFSFSTDSLQFSVGYFLFVIGELVAIIPLLHLPCLCRKPEQGDICSVQSLLWCMSALVGQAYAVRLQHDEPLAVKLAYSPLESFLAHPEGGVDGGGIAAVVQTDMSALLPEVLQ